MNSAVLAFVLTTVFGALSAEQPSIPFYSSSGGSYLFMSNFSKETSFAKFSQNLLVMNDTNKKSERRLLPTIGAPFQLRDVEYYTSETSYSSDEEKHKWMRKCVLRLNQSEALNDVYLSDGISHVDTLLWSCPAHGWCCGIECCQPYYKSPWAVIGPDAIAVVCGIVAFFLCFGVLEAISRLRKVFVDENDDVKSMQLDNGHYMPTMEQKKGL